ncbi:MAG: DUF3667 domain-containing protein [Ignavibacteria bacterium]|nr:DUF3667 domain-containing protein [Ignavibacteria bacterium]
MTKCINCGRESDGKYCPSCGQEVEIKRLEAKLILHDITHGVLHWENSILKTFKFLLINPGGTAKNYISGLRKPYVKPFSYFIFIQTIYVIFFHSMNEKYFAFLNFTVNNGGAMQDKIEQMQHVINAYINYFNYFMPVFFALFYYLIFRKKTGINYAESLVIAFYWIGTTLIFGVVLMIISLINIGFWNARIMVSYLFLVFAILQFTGMPKFKGILKATLVIFLSYTAYGVFVGAILLAYFYIITKGAIIQ